MNKWQKKAQRKLEDKAEKAKSDTKNFSLASNLFARAERVTKEKEKNFNTSLAKDKDGDYLLTMLKKGT